MKKKSGILEKIPLTSAKKKKTNTYNIFCSAVDIMKDVWKNPTMPH